MLKRQSIITEDPVYINKSATTPLPQKTKSIFDGDEEKSRVKYLFHKDNKQLNIFFCILKTLQRLLKSRRPEDLEQANALIKSFVKKV